MNKNCADALILHQKSLNNSMHLMRVSHVLILVLYFYWRVADIILTYLNLQLDYICQLAFGQCLSKQSKLLDIKRQNQNKSKLLKTERANCVSLCKPVAVLLYTYLYTFNHSSCIFLSKNINEIIKYLNILVYHFLLVIA